MSLIDFIGCDACSLKKEWPFLRTPKMAMTSPQDPDPIKILILGEGPGEQEDLKGTQFVGPTGQYLRDRIPAKWKRSLYFQNVVRCQPPKNRNPTPQEMTCCSTYLEEDLLKAKPQAILGVGNIALQYFWPDFNKGISKARGIAIPIKYEDGSTAWFMPVFHPSYAVRGEKKQPDGTYKNVIEPIFRNDIKRFFDYIPTKFATPPAIYDPPIKEFLYPKTYNEAWNLFQQLDDPYAIDFETFKTKPYKRDAKPLTMALSDSKITFAVPVLWPGDINPWGLQLLKDIIASGKTWICQSGAMEYLWIAYLTGVRCEEFHDTEVIARLLHDRTGLGALEHTSRIYLGFNVKALSNLDKNRMNEYPLNQVLPYNALDSWSTYKVFSIMMRMLCDRPGNFVQHYLSTLETIKSTVEMELRGLDVDITQSESMQKALYEQQQKLIGDSKAIKEVKEYQETESTRFNISAPQDVARVLTSYCGIQLYKNEETGNYSTEEDELTPFIGVHPLVDLTLEYREVAKQLSTYVMPILNGEILGIDGKLHPAYKTVHVKTWRLSSELPNIQNWPKRKNREIRRQLIPPSGHFFVACDYGGLEARTLQMASGDENLKLSLIDPERYLKDVDIHWYWLNRIVDYYYPEYIKRLADKSGETETKKILKAGRTIIKTDFVFSSFYGSLPDAIANKTMIPLNIVKDIHQEFWGKYTKVRDWINGQIAFYEQFGYVESLTGRIRNEILPGWEITNTPIQGTGAEIVLEAQNALYIKGMTEDIVFLPRINVHDDLTFFVPDNNDTERYIKVIMDEMVKPRFSFITCPLLVECSIGDKNWCDMQEITKHTGDVWKPATSQ